jgi:nitrogen regulatory protein PII
MHEIRATIPPGWVSEAARLAHAAGVEAVTVTEVFVHGPGEKRSVVSVETSTPKARAFVDSLLASPTFSKTEYTLTSREVRAIVSKEPVGQVTQPMSEPFPDVIQDLWQLSHLTPSYIGRAAGGAALLATGVIEDSPIAIVVAVLILPFLSQVLAVGFGLWSRDHGLMRQGLLVTISGSAVVAYALLHFRQAGMTAFHSSR